MESEETEHINFETENSVYYNGKFYDKGHMVLVLPDGTRMERLTPVNGSEGPFVNSIAGSVGMEFPNSDVYYTNPTISVDTVRHASKHYLVARILRQIDAFAFNDAKIKVVPPEDESKEISEDEIDEVQSKVDEIDSKIIKTITRCRQATYDQIIYGSAVFERISGKIEGWQAPVVMKRLPAYSFCERPIGRMDIQKYVTGDILYGIIFDKDAEKYEFWQKQNEIDIPVQVPTKNVIHIRDEVSEGVDGESFIAKVLPLVRKLEFSDQALMETVHRAGAPLLWLKIEEYRDNPQAAPGMWTPKKAYDEGKKIAMNHGKNNAMVAPSSITPVPLDYTLPLNPIEVVKSFEMRVLYALIPKDFTEDAGVAISKSSAPALKLLTLVAQGWRDQVSKPFIEMWNKILADNDLKGWKVEIQWRDLDPVDESELYKRAQIAFAMGTTFSEDEIREIAGWTAKSEDTKKQEAEDAKKAMLEQQQLMGAQPNVPGTPGAIPKPKPKVEPQGPNVKTEKGEPVKDKQQEPIKNAQINEDKTEPSEHLENTLEEKTRMFETWLKNMGYLKE